MVQLQLVLRIYGINPIFFIDGLPENQPPTPIPSLKKIVGARHAEYIAQHTIDLGSLRYMNLGLRDRTIPRQIDHRSAERVKNADSPLPAVIGCRNELFYASFRPGSLHAAIFMPDRTECVPISCVAGNSPFLNQLFYDLPIKKLVATFHISPAIILSHRFSILF